MSLRRLFDIHRWRPSRSNTRDEIDEEFRFHLEQRVLDSVAEGIEPEEARRDAERRFGDTRRYREQGEKVLNGHVRTQARASFVESVIQDVRVATRVAARTPLVTTLAITALALGIGANTVVFSVVEAVLLPAPGIPDADRVVQVQTMRAGRAVSQVPDRYFEYRDQTTAFDKFEAFYWDLYLLEGMLRPTMTLVASDGLLDLLGVEPFLGRTLSPSPDVRRAPAGLSSEMMLAHDFWLGHFGGDSTVVGRTVRFGNAPGSDELILRTIVGVLPPGFDLPPHIRGGDLEIGPARELRAVIPLSEGLWDRDRRVTAFFALARLKEESTLEGAQSQVEVVSTQIGAAHPDEAEYVPLVTPITTLPNMVYGRAIGMLWAVVVSVLLIACLNVAALLLARTSTRDGEFAVRSSLGGAGARVARQLLTESLLLALAGATLGIGLAWAGTRTAIALFPGAVLGLSEAGINGTVLGATLVLTVTTVLLFGWAPLLIASRTDVSARLKAAGRGVALGPGRLLGSLVVVEVALALGLFGGAALLLNSFVRLTQVELGFDEDNVLVLGVGLPGPQMSKYGEGASRTPIHDLYEQVFASVQAVPGVRQVALGAGSGWGVPLMTATATRLTVEDRHGPGREEGLRAVWSLVGAEYFDVMGIPVMAGRVFTPEDEYLAVVSESAAREFWPGQDPIGKRFTYGWQDLDNAVNDPRYLPPQLGSVIGVVGDVTTSELRERSTAMVYLPFRATGQRDATLLVRTTVRPESVAAAVREAVLVVDEAEIDVSSVTTTDDLFSEAVAAPRFYAFVLGLLSLSAIVLVVSAVYGVLAYSVGRRTRELGLRVALGARREQLLGMVLRQGMVPVLLGVAGGITLLAYLGRFLSGYLYDVGSFDPLTVGVCSVLLCAMAALACYMPARRASAVDPVNSLRAE